MSAGGRNVPEYESKQAQTGEKEKPPQHVLCTSQQRKSLKGSKDEKKESSGDGGGDCCPKISTAQELAVPYG